MFVIYYLLMGGAEPSSPFPDCGESSSSEPILDCAAYPVCET